MSRGEIFSKYHAAPLLRALPGSRTGRQAPSASRSSSALETLSNETGDDGEKKEEEDEASEEDVLERYNLSWEKNDLRKRETKWEKKELTMSFTRARIDTSGSRALMF